jgi:hypothetical protein
MSLTVKAGVVVKPSVKGMLPAAGGLLYVVLSVWRGGYHRAASSSVALSVFLGGLWYAALRRTVVVPERRDR